MADKTHDDLDVLLDAALAKYAAVEPRAGLENRVLANLRAEPVPAASRAWWRWGLPGAAVAILAIALTLSWKLERPSFPVIARHPPVATHSTAQPGTERASRDGVEVSPRARAPIHAVTRRSLPLATVAAGPKLDVFPAPLPLSEQEKLLAGYVAEEPKHAVLLARAQAEALSRDQEEELRESGASNRENSQ